MATNAVRDECASAEARAGFYFAGLLALDADDSGDPHCSLLSWVLGLPVDLDPACMAREVLGYQHGNPQHRLSAALRGLLEDVTRFPEPRLRRFQRRRGRRDLGDASCALDMSPVAAPGGAIARRGHRQPFPATVLSCFD